MARTGSFARDPVEVIICQGNDMLCISITQESRRLVPADMLNASRQCDLLEIRLDCFLKAVNTRDLLQGRPKPVILTCRRPRDGGAYQGTEEQRLALLRQAIIDQADYVEIELDVADQIPPLPPTKRIISYTNLTETPSNIEEIYAQALTRKPDVIKLTTVANTPEEAWPLVRILARQTVPTVVVGLGKPGVLLTILGKKIGAPWIYAALEAGMQAYDGQPTISELQQVYHYQGIGRSTPLLAVTGFGDRERATVAALNTGFVHLGKAIRCLPLGIGKLETFRKVLDAVKVAGVVVDADNQGAILSVANEVDASAQKIGQADLLVRKEERWVAYDTLGPTIRSALEAATLSQTPPRPLAGRVVAIVGGNAVAREIARELKDLGCPIILTGSDDAAALARELGCRHVRFEAIYTTLHDILIVCNDPHESATGRTPVRVHPGYLRSGMVVVEVRSALHKSTLVRAALARECPTVSPYQLWLNQTARQIRRLTGKEVPLQLLADAAPWLTEEE